MGLPFIPQMLVEPHGPSSLVLDTRVMECYNDCILSLSVDRPPSAGIQGPGHFNLYIPRAVVVAQ